MAKINKGIIASTFKLDCDRYLRFSLASIEERKALGIPDNAGERTGMGLVKEAGLFEESEKYHDLINFAKECGWRIEYRCEDGNGDSSGCEPFDKVENVFELLRKQKPPQAIIEAEFEVPKNTTPGLQKAHDDFDLDPVKIRPDILWIQPYVPESQPSRNKILPEYEIRIVDAKAAEEPSSSHFVEVTYYALALTAAIKREGLDKRYAVSARGYIWPGRRRIKDFEFELKNAKGCFDKGDFRGTSDSDAFVDMLVPARELYEVHVKRFFDDRLGRVIKTNMEEADWHVGPKCQLCVYLDYCRKQASTDDHLSRLAWLTQGQAKLLRSHGISTTADFIKSAMNEDGRLESAAESNHRLRADKEALLTRARSLAEETPIPIAGRRCATMPRRTHQRIFITVHFDPVSGLAFALGASRLYYSCNTNRMVDGNRIFIVDCDDAEKVKTEREKFKEFISVIIGWLEEISNDNKDPSSNERMTSHIYFWNTPSINQLKRMYRRHTGNHDVDELIEKLIRFFPLASMLPDSEVFRSQPGTIVREAIRTLLGLPVAHNYSLLDAANSFLPNGGEGGFRQNLGFSAPMSDQIPFERAYEVWQSRSLLRHSTGSQHEGRLYTRNEVVDGIVQATKIHLQALQHIVRSMLERYEKRMLLKKNGFSIAKPSLPDAPAKAIALINFERLNAASREMENRYIRALPVDEREAKFFSIRGLRRLNPCEENKLLKKLKSDPKHQNDELYVFGFSKKSTESRIKENEFTVALSNEGEYADFNEPWPRQIKLSDQEAKNLLKNSNCPWWYSKKSIGELLQVEVIELTSTGNEPCVILKPGDAGLFRFAINQGIVRLDKPLVLDPIHRDFTSEMMARALTIIGGKASGARIEPAYSLIYDPLSLSTEKSSVDAERLCTKIDPCLGDALNKEQRVFFRKTFECRASLLWGPPGTGKTAALTGVILGWIDHHADKGMPLRIAIGSNTYKAIDNVLEKIVRPIDIWKGKIYSGCGTGCPITVARLRSGSAEPPSHPLKERVRDVVRKSPNAEVLVRDMKARHSGIIIVGGTWQQLARLAKAHHPDKDPVAEWFDLLVIDEASQVQVAAAAAYYLLLKPCAHVVIAGDDKQLGPIYGFQVESEDREEGKGLFDCTFSYMKELRVDPVRLVKNYRTNEEIAAWPRKRFYDEKYVAVKLGRRLNISINIDERPTDWPNRLPWSRHFSSILDPACPVVVISHPRNTDTLSNMFEAQMAASLIFLYRKLVDNQPNKPRSEDFWNREVGVVTPHRAQMACIKKILADDAGMANNPTPVVDTVDRFQGQERSMILSSYAVSDPEFIASEDEFIFDARRFNVTLTRAKSKFIMFISDSLLHHLPSRPIVARDAEHIQLFAEQYCHSVCDTIELPFFDGGKESVIECEMRGRR